MGVANDSVMRLSCLRLLVVGWGRGVDSILGCFLHAHAVEQIDLSVTTFLRATLHLWEEVDILPSTFSCTLKSAAVLAGAVRRPILKRHKSESLCKLRIC